MGSLRLSQRPSARLLPGCCVVWGRQPSRAPLCPGNSKRSACMLGKFACSLARFWHGLLHVTHAHMHPSHTYPTYVLRTRHPCAHIAHFAHCTRRDKPWPVVWLHAIIAAANCYLFARTRPSEQRPKKAAEDNAPGRDGRQQNLVKPQLSE